MIPLLAGAVGCGGVECRDADQVLAEGPDGRLTCGDAAAVRSWIELVAGRPVAPADRGVAPAALLAEWSEDPASTRELLAAVRTEGPGLAARTGMAGMEARAHRAWLADAGRDLVRPEHGDLWNLQRRTMSVWVKSDAEELAVTESDLEAWIRYASLCREAQGAGVLKVSVGDRVPVYQSLIARFSDGDRATKIAVAALGPVWESQVKDAWRAAPFDRQQAWIAAAPLPPPMQATSMGYADAIFSGDLPGHARAVHDVLGPFRVGDPAGFGGVP